MTTNTIAGIFEIPLTPEPQTFTITLGGKDYRLTITYKDVTEGGWVVDISDLNDTKLVVGIPLVTGVDLLEPYAYLNFGGELVIQTTADPDAVPTFENLGIGSLLYWIPKQ